ncbi:vomeronasal type-2 receptor 26-like [Leptodactylus fuscus]|uniref:vomeronasal type-2 receptor 26-like n=1 Tax=Leptodactylus fuscus TaxID=238119 RepID=UPI003F4E4C24
MPTTRCPGEVEKYRSVLSFIYAVDEINNNPDLLPNITLGYHIVDTCSDSLKTAHAFFRILAGRNMAAPNYFCGDHGKVAAFVVDSNYHTSHTMIPLFNLYKYTQLMFGVSHPILHDRDLYPTSYQFTPDDRNRYEAIVMFVHYRGWNWVGIITTGEGSNEVGVKELRKLMAKSGICINYVINIGDRYEKTTKHISVINNSTAEVAIVCGPYSIKYWNFISRCRKLVENITLILHESWADLLVSNEVFPGQFLNGSIVFIPERRGILKVENFIYHVNPITHPNDPLLEDIYYRVFRCLTKDNNKNYFYKWVYKVSGKNCTEIHRIPTKSYESKDTSLYYTYISVYILAHALHKMKVTGKKLSMYQIQDKFQKYMKYVHFKDPNGKDIFFNDDGDVYFPWEIENWVVYISGNLFGYKAKIIASIEEESKGKYNIYLGNEELVWKNNRMPKSRCNDRCSPGFRKAPNGGYHVCCYDCVPCSEDEMSNKTDSDSCYKCPEEEWPDEKKVKCIPKTYEFLSYGKDILVYVFMSFSLLFSIITLFVLGIFIYYWDSPIVKANNRTVSFILLVSILLGFLCVLFFLGRPMDITCLLRQTSFGIFFSIGVSSVLAKTITVCIAFKATKPGSVWVKWISSKVSYSVILVCSSVQILICVIWLLVSPPYVEFDHQSYPGKIIIQCNEGSDLWFYSMLGYMGLLAAVSFLLAFMVRTLPDSFNEAKYITFSMLLFCSVWIAMIPAYLSTRGKYMVAVEIFAILTSCAGILGCIFLPKLHILLITPGLNSRIIIIKKNNHKNNTTIRLG